MGMVQFGAPLEIIQDLARLTGAEVFVETGTYVGGTAVLASTLFTSVVTIELSEELFRMNQENLRDLKNIQQFCGDSRVLLPTIVAKLDELELPAVFWLDGHWSGDETAGNEAGCPLLGELQALRHRRRDIILIDDARLFLSAPPEPHVPDGWPTLAEIIPFLDGEDHSSFIQIIDDVIFVVPADPPIKDLLIQYGRRRAQIFWQKYLSKGA